MSGLGVGPWSVPGFGTGYCMQIWPRLGPTLDDKS